MEGVGGREVWRRVPDKYTPEVSVVLDNRRIDSAQCPIHLNPPVPTTYRERERRRRRRGRRGGGGEEGNIIIILLLSLLSNLLSFLYFDICVYNLS